MGQTRQELPGRIRTATGLRCPCCGEPLAGATAVTAVLREIAYEYCGDECRDRHAALVALGPDRCECCDFDAVGDTDRCAAHLEADPDADLSWAGDYPLAG